MADFTFYGGIYRNVNLIAVADSHFDLDYFGAPGIKVTPKVEGTNAEVKVEVYTTGVKEGQQIRFELLDKEGNVVFSATQSAAETTAKTTLENVHLWNGRKDPYLYGAKATLLDGTEEIDSISTRFGCRSYVIDPEKGFILNGESYPLRGVSRHQDRWGIGNALLPQHHEEDIDLIMELGATTIRLAHYQHDQYFYDLCDEAGMIVWAEIPYISEHMPGGRANTISQMKELILQNYNHASIVTWGLSNEITISTKDKADMLDNHRVLNDLCHHYDATRPTTLACYAMCNPFGKVVHISDLVSYNLYLGWYVPGKFLNDLFFLLFHARYPKRCLGYSEYGAEGMPNLHSEHPRRGDHTEEYQARYHEYMIRCFARFPWLWSTHVWNMFDFAADARDQGGEPGMNHKGLVTFDRKTKKDSFYLYKSYWNPAPMVHICSKRFEERGQDTISVRVYSNQKVVSLYCNDKFVAEKSGDHVFTFSVPLTEGGNHIRVVAGDLEDETVFIRKANPKSYKLEKKRSKSANWV
jgi:beta-galactosidase